LAKPEIENISDPEFESPFPLEQNDIADPFQTMKWES
jgi:hypothetical protein